MKLCLALLLPSCFIAATLLYNHKISFHAAMVKRPVSKLTKAVQQVTKRERKERTLYLGGRWNNFDLTLAVCKHLHTIGFDKNGFELWTESRDIYDCYLQQGRQLVESPEKILREGIYYACFWSDGIGKLSGDQLKGLVELLDDLAEAESSKTQQRGPYVGQETFTYPYGHFLANQAEAGPSAHPGATVS